MSNLRTDLESIKERFSDEVFLSNKGLSNEVDSYQFLRLGAYGMRGYAVKN